MVDFRRRLDIDVFKSILDMIKNDGLSCDICKNIFSQMIEASRAENIFIKEFLTASTLEAAIRTIEGKAHSDKGFNLKSGVARFKNNHLCTKSKSKKRWKQYTNMSAEAYSRLRNRNAHPNWLLSTGGALSYEERKTALDDIIYLSSFYGYMILALSGIKDLLPKFPLPHDQWGAAATFTYKDISESSVFDSSMAEFFEELNKAKSSHARKMMWKRFNEEMESDDNG